MTAADETPDPVADVEIGHESTAGEFRLTWGVKESFVRYIFMMAGGQAELTDDADFTRDGQGEYPFDASADRADGVIRFRGAIRYSGHGGMLSLRICDPWLVPTGDGVDLTMADPSAPGARVTLAHARIDYRTDDPSALVCVGTDVVLADEAWGLFNGTYPAGTEMDPFVARIPAG